MAPYGAVEAGAGVSHLGATRRGRWIPLVVGAAVLSMAAAVAVVAVMLSPLELSGATALLLRPALATSQRKAAAAGKAKDAPGRLRDALGEDLQRDLKLARALSAQDPRVQHSALRSAVSVVEKRLQQDGKVAASLLKLAGEQHKAGDAGDYSKADADALLLLGKTTMLRRRSYAAAGGAARFVKATHADKKAEEQANKEIKQLGLGGRLGLKYGSREDKKHPKSFCHPPHVWDEKRKTCLTDPRSVPAPRGCTPYSRKYHCRQYYRKRRKKLRYFGRRVRDEQRKIKRRWLHPTKKYSSMTAKAAQAIFSIKPYHYPAHVAKLGDDYLEQGYAPNRPLNEVFSDRTYDVGDPRTRSPLLFGDAPRKNTRSPYRAGYFNPYSRDSLAHKRYRGAYSNHAPRIHHGWSDGPLATTRGEGRPYDPRKHTGGSARPIRNPAVARIMRRMDTGPFESSKRNPYNPPYVSRPVMRSPRSPYKGRTRDPNYKGRHPYGPRSRGPRSRFRRPYRAARRRAGGNGLLGLGDAYRPPAVARKQFHPRIASRSPSSRGVVPTKLRPKYNKIIGRLGLEKDDLEDAVEDVKDASKAGLNPADVVDDGELGKKKGLKLPEAIKEYQKEIEKDRAELAKIPTVFPDKGILGGGAEDSLDDIIPNTVVKEVYRMIPGPKAHPEGEPITDFLHNGWNPLNGVADP